MNSIVLVVVLGALLQSTFVLSQSYWAALALYKPNDSPNTPDEDLAENSANYVKYIQQLKDKADIVIFPEYGLTKIDAMQKQIAHLESYSTVVRNVGDQYDNCTATNTKDILRNLACAAKENGVYVIFNLVEKQNNKTYYVTNVGIDATGTICLKCRKRHYNNGTSFTPDENQECSFTAKFKNSSVDFAVMFETDMLYAIPDHMKKDNIIMTSAIKNTLPFEYGPSLHAGFAINNNVNLLVSAYSDTKEISNSYGGSGIYLKNGKSMIAFDSGSEAFLIKPIPLTSDSTSKKIVSVQIQGVTPHWNLAYQNTSYILDANKSVHECLEDKSFCCKFEADVSQDSIEPYRWVILRANKSTILDQQVDAFVCALVKPDAATAPKPPPLKSVVITSSVRDRVDLQTIPIAVDANLSLPLYEYAANARPEDVSVKLSRPDELLSFGVIRVLGGGAAAGSRYTGIIVGVVVGVLVVLGLAAGGWWWYKRNGGYMRPGNKI